MPHDPLNCAIYRLSYTFLCFGSCTIWTRWNERNRSTRSLFLELLTWISSWDRRRQEKSWLQQTIKTAHTNSEVSFCIKAQAHITVTMKLRSTTSSKLSQPLLMAQKWTILEMAPGFFSMMRLLPKSNHWGKKLLWRNPTARTPGTKRKGELFVSSNFWQLIYWQTRSVRCSEKESGCEETKAHTG